MPRVLIIWLRTCQLRPYTTWFSLVHFSIGFSTYFSLSFVEVGYGRSISTFLMVIGPCWTTDRMRVCSTERWMSIRVLYLLKFSWKYLLGIELVSGILKNKITSLRKWFFKKSLDMFNQLVWLVVRTTTLIPLVGPVSKWKSTFGIGGVLIDFQTFLKIDFISSYATEVF